MLRGVPQTVNNKDQPGNEYGHAPPPSVFLSSINPRDIFKTCIFASKFSTEHHHMHAHSFFCVRLSARDLREEKRLRNTGKNLKLSM